MTYDQLRQLGVWTRFEELSGQIKSLEREITSMQDWLADIEKRLQTLEKKNGTKSD